MSLVNKIIINLTDIILGTYITLIFISVILSWIMPPTNALRQFIGFVTDPVIRPIRKLMQPLMAKSSIPLDFSPIIAIILISILRWLLQVLWISIF